MIVFLRRNILLLTKTKEPSKACRSDPLLQYGVVTRTNHVQGAIKSTVLGKVSLFDKTVGIQEATRFRSYLSNGHSSGSGPKF